MPDCTACGHKIDEGDAFCRACGAATGVAAPTPPQTGDGPPRPSSRRDLLFVVVLVAVISAIAVVLGLTVSFGPSADDFVGSWAAGGDIGVGLTVQKQDGQLLADLTGFGIGGEGTTVPAALSGDTLSFEYVDDTSASSTDGMDSQTVAFTATLENADALRLTIFVPGMEAYTTTILLTPADSAAAKAASAEQIQKAQDSAVKEGVHSLQVGVQSWAVDHNDRYPQAAMMTPDGQVGKMMDGEMAPIWPTNPFTGEPMKASASLGDFTYTVEPDGSGFTLSGHLSGGTDFTVP